MTKQGFLAQLRNRLSGLPQNEVEERLAFYGEMVDDRMEEGLSEENAVCQIGNVDDIAAQIIADTPITKLVRERMRPSQAHHVWESILLAVGAPLWIPLLATVAAVILSVYAVLWVLILSFWAVELSLCGCVLAGLAAGGLIICKGYGLTGIALIGAGIACAGFSIFLFYGCMAATKGILRLSKKVTMRIKNCFIKKGEAR